MTSPCSVPLSELAREAGAHAAAVEAMGGSGEARRAARWLAGVEVALPLLCEHGVPRGTVEATRSLASALRESFPEVCHQGQVERSVLWLLGIEAAAVAVSGSAGV